MSLNKPKSHRIEKVNHRFHWYKIFYRTSTKIKRGGLFLIHKIQTLISRTPVDFSNASASLLRTKLLTFSISCFLYLWRCTELTATRLHFMIGKLMMCRLKTMRFQENKKDTTLHCLIFNPRAQHFFLGFILFFVLLK